MRLIKEIKSKKGDLHFQRWSIFSSKKLGIFIHKIFKKDEDRFMHSHPWHIFTIVLKGSYEERILTKSGKEKIVKRGFLHFAFRSRSRFHKIEKVNEPTTTLAIVFGKRRDWGYWVNMKGHDIVTNEMFRKWKDYFNSL